MSVADGRTLWPSGEPHAAHPGTWDPEAWDRWYTAETAKAGATPVMYDDGTERAPIRLAVTVQRGPVIGLAYKPRRQPEARPQQPERKGIL